MMLKRAFAVLLMFVVFGLGLGGCSSVAAGLKSYVDSYDGYEFFYPNGWVEVQVKDGPDVILHDIIQESENISVVISPVEEGRQLEDLGTPLEIGQRLVQGVISDADAVRKAELVNAASREIDGVKYFLLEYEVDLPQQPKRHNIASAVIRRGKLFTLNASTSESRWDRMSETFQAVVNSFQVY